MIKETGEDVWRVYDYIDNCKCWTCNRKRQSARDCRANTPKNKCKYDCLSISVHSTYLLKSTLYHQSVGLRSKKCLYLVVEQYFYYSQQPGPGPLAIGPSVCASSGDRLRKYVYVFGFKFLFECINILDNLLRQTRNSPQDYPTLEWTLSMLQWWPSLNCCLSSLLFFWLSIAC